MLTFVYYGGDAPADRRQQFQTQDERVARHYFLAEFHAVDLHEVGGIPFGLIHRIEHQQTARLRHRFHL